MGEREDGFPGQSMQLEGCGEDAAYEMRSKPACMLSSCPAAVMPSES